MNTCPHCGRDTQTDTEVQLETIGQMADVVAVPIETMDILKQEIELLNDMIKNNLPHTDRTEKLTTQSLSILDIVLKD